MIQDYYILDYIQSSGSQYINTNLPKQAYSYLGLDMKMMKVGSVSYDYMFGQYSGINGCYFMNCYVNNFHFLIGTDDGSTYGDIPMSQNVLYDLKTHISGTNGYANYNGTIIERSNLNSVTISKNFLLFAGEHQNGNIYYSKIRIYECKIYGNNQELLRDFVPAMRKSDSVVGLYDKANDTFYTNSGSGTFTYGQIVPQVYSSVNPIGSGSVSVSESSGTYTITATPNSSYRFLDWTLDGYTQLEYIESSGTQYINTLYIPSTSIKLDFDFDALALSDKRFFGEHESNDSKCFGFGINASNKFENISGSWNAGTTISLNQNIKGTVEVANGKTIYNIPNVITGAYNNAVNGATQNCFLFARNLNGSANQNASMRLYYFKIYDNNTLVRDFIPVIRHSDGQIGLLDLVHFKFYGNNGSGNFIGGGIVE